MSIWDELDKEASKDNRIGNHDFVVDAINEGEWEPGRKYRELDGRLVTAENFNLKQRFNVTPPEDVVEREMKNWPRNVVQSVNLSHQNDEVLMKEYGVTLEQIKPGDTFRVKTDKKADKNDRNKYYIQLINFLPKTASLSSNGDKDPTPF